MSTILLIDDLRNFRDPSITAQAQPPDMRMRCRSALARIALHLTDRHGRHCVCPLRFASDSRQTSSGW